MCLGIGASIVISRSYMYTKMCCIYINYKNILYGQLINVQI